MLARFRLDVFVQAVSVRIHRDDRWKIADGEMPHGFGRAEVEQRHAVDAGDRPRVELRRAADRVQVYGPVFLQRGERLRAHAAFTDDGTDAVPLDDLALIRLLPNAGRRPRGSDAPALALLHGDGTAMVENAAAQVDRRRVLHQVRVHGIAAREDAARDQHDVADLQRARL